MNRFLIRVQLHNEYDYTQLHRAMDQRGFTRTIVGGDGKEYHLPNGSYRFEGRDTIEQVRDRAVEAAHATGRSYEVIVTEGCSAWSNLNEVATSAAYRR